MATAMTPAVSGAKAGFWIRVVAYIIDAIIVGIIAFIVSLIFGVTKSGYPQNQSISILFFVIYFTYMFSANGFIGPGQTIGMRVLNLKVVTVTGESLDLTKALIRAIILVAEVEILIIGWIGLIWAAFDPQKQAVHDKVAGTYVVKV
jgi:uncharacterized RDD family membrane protein YckC